MSRMPPKTEATLQSAIPVLPTGDLPASLRWWTEVCGFSEVFRHGDPPAYAGIARGPVRLHLARIEDAALARTVGDQTMLRLVVTGIDALYAEYQTRGGEVHPNGPLREQPWGGRAFGAIDPGGVCVTFTEP
jgi:catechol 2,3-dioxygenase-like lactoylglutathione lyase family enzyme